MDPSFLLPPQFSIFKAFLFLSFLFPTYLAGEDERYSACTPFSCGTLTEISYPFWGNQQPDYCGHPKFKLDCQGDSVNITINSQNFRVIDVNLTTQILRIARMDLWDSRCPNKYTNISMDYGFFNYTPGDEYSTLLYDCDVLEYISPVNLSSSVKFDCPIDGIPRDAYFIVSTKWGDETFLGCNIGITVPILGVAIANFIIDVSDVGSMINQGFEVKWEVDEGKCENCRESGGRCGHNVSEDDFRCFCPKSNQPYAGTCSSNPLWAPAPAPAPAPLLPTVSEQSTYSTIPTS